MPRLCLAAISQTDTALRYTSLSGSTKAFLADADSAVSSVMSHRNVHVSRRIRNGFHPGILAGALREEDQRIPWGW